MCTDMSGSVVSLALLSVILAWTAVQEVQSARHCIYKFRVPAADMDLSCPGLRTHHFLDEDEGEEVVEAEQYEAEEAVRGDDVMVTRLTKSPPSHPPQSYYSNPILTGSGDFTEITPTPTTPPPHKKRHRKKRKEKRGDKRSNKTKRGDMTQAQEGVEGTEHGYSPAGRNPVFTLDDGTVKALASMVKIMDQGGVQADQASANRWVLKY